jgi:para-nitrobenzyl esterase
MRKSGLLALGLGMVAGAAAAAAPVVRIETGRVAGVAASAGSPVQIFRGIPYAAPPVGDLRWRPPAPAAPWNGVRLATQFGARCMQQHLWDDMIFRSPAASEDCLYLNVWTPATLSHGAKAELPVLVYVYGGGFQAGDSSEPRYDGAAMASHGIVVVTMNYRLGVFGFLAHPALTAESPSHASGNYGLLDQAAAIAWVKRNIAAFGGDPNRITIGGESAGSMSVSALMASPLTRNLIAGAIGESGSAMDPRFAARATAEAAGAAYAAGLGAATLTSLRAVSADKMLETQGKDDKAFRPIIDGYFLPEPAADTFAAGHSAHVPLLVGSNSQEGPASVILGFGPPTVSNYRAGLVRQFADRADAVLALYPAATDADVMQAATDLASDMFLGLTTWKWFDLHRRSGAPTYYYYYRRVRPAALNWKSSPAYGAVHSSEIEYALGNIDANPSYAWTDEDRRVSATMNGYFVNFVKTGDPNGPGLPPWPRAAGDDAQIQRQIIDVDTKSAPFANQARAAAAEPLLVHP